MSLDAITIHALCDELGRELSEGRIDKIYMPRKDEVIFSCRVGKISHRLVISCNGSGGRVYLTDEKTENPDAPPMFCMLLRKHLTAARFLEISQPQMERMLWFRFSAYDDFGELSEKILVAELTGRRTNLILLAADGTILGCMKKVDAEMSPTRPVLPGLRYQMPPRPEQLSLMALEPAGAEKIAAEAFKAEAPEKELAAIDLLSPIVAKELVFSCGGAVESLASGLMSLKKRVENKEFEPTMIENDAGYLDFTFMKMKHFGDSAQCRSMASFSELICEYYANKTAAERKKNAASELLKLMSNAENRLIKKLANQENDLLKAQKREALKKNADLITANLHRIEPNSDHAVVVDYFDEQLPEITIKLDADLSPQQNAQRLFQEYTKMKNAEEQLTRQIGQGKEELEYVQSVLLSLQAAKDEKEVSAIREELSESGYLRSKEKGKRKKPAALHPLEFTSPGGYKILCGRNNRENDELTLKTAGKQDLWFHSHLAPGSHVILFIQGGTPAEADLEYAASLAAGHSRLSGQSLAAIDYAAAKFVKKPSGAKPGMVIYTNYKTLFVKPAQQPQK